MQTLSFASSISKSGSSCPSMDYDVTRSATDLATSTSLTHTNTTARQLEHQHTSVLEIGLPTPEGRCVREFVEMQFRDLISRMFHHTSLRISSSCTMHRKHITRELSNSFSPCKAKLFVILQLLGNFLHNLPEKLCFSSPSSGLELHASFKKTSVTTLHLPFSSVQFRLCFR